MKRNIELLLKNKFLFFFTFLQVAEKEITHKWLSVSGVWGSDWQPGDLHDPSAPAPATPAENRSTALPAGHHHPHSSAGPGAVVLLRHTPKEETHHLLPHSCTLLFGLLVLPLHHRDFASWRCQPAAGVHCYRWNGSDNGFSDSHQERSRICDCFPLWGKQPQEEH